MSNWQKVRVTFTDAEGNEVSAVMWALPKYYPTAVHLNADHSDFGLCIDWANNDKWIKVEPIRELPTRLGAVVEFSTVPGVIQRCVYVGEMDFGNPYVWFNVTNGVTYKTSEIPENFTVLSGGIEL